jgi:hypothetical protein
MVYIYTPFMKKVLHITERKRKSNVHHYCKSDHFRAGFKVAEWRIFDHPNMLQISPARFKNVKSDSADEAHDWLNQIKSGKQIAGLKQQTGLLDRTIWKRMRLACLSPKVQKAILAGTLHHDITIKNLESKAVPVNWAEQEALYIGKVPC